MATSPKRYELLIKYFVDSNYITKIRQDGKINFLTDKTVANFKRERDFLDTIKSKIKYFVGKFYPLLVNIFAPVLPRIHWATLEDYFKYLVRTESKNKEIIIQIGSGNYRINDRIINIDIFDFPEVDMIADCTHLPIQGNCVDGVISSAVLEHVESPEIFLKEAQRVLKKGGFIITGVPFIQGVHASPSDYYRWTEAGLESLHKKFGFTKKKIIPYAGPMSGFLWILQEWLSIILSFNLNFLYYFWWFLLLFLLFPFKIFDILFIYYNQAHKINSFNIYIGIKD